MSAVRPPETDLSRISWPFRRTEMPLYCVDCGAAMAPGVFKGPVFDAWTGMQIEPPPIRECSLHPKKHPYWKELSEGHWE